MTMVKSICEPVHALRSGYVTAGSGETIVSVSAGVRTPRGKMDVVLEKDGKQRLVIWGRHTLINIRAESVR